jgi:hypothetical protein
MENSPSTIHYTPGAQKQVSIKTALIVAATAIVLVGAVLLVAR